MKARVLIVLLLSSALFAADVGQKISPADALKLLQEGNKRFVSGHLTLQKHSNAADRRRLSQVQNPFAIVLACSDSRVAPELLFDQGLGQIFVIRVAGNVPDAFVLGSMEYSVEHLGSSLIVVLGHERCGAVKATVDGGTIPPHIDSIVAAIQPAVETARKNTKNPALLLDAAIAENARRAAASILEQSPIIAEHSRESKVKVVSAVYDLDDGTVVWNTGSKTFNNGVTMAGWFYSKGQSQNGPFEWEALVTLGREGKLSAADLVWTEGMPQWSPASAVPGLLVAQPPPLPPRIQYPSSRRGTIPCCGCLCRWDGPDGPLPPDIWDCFRFWLSLPPSH